MDSISVGKFVATFGVEGELVLLHALGKKTDLSGVKYILIEDKTGQKLPYFIQQARGKNHQETYVKLEGIVTKEAAQTLTRKAVWLSVADFEQHVAASSTIALLGFTMLEDKQPIGEIVEVIEQPHQVLCTVKVGQKEALVPLHAESLVSINRKLKQVHVSLPHGLLDIYLNP
ncbi:MAG: 16S rRNA processing protein RimM [Bacteroidetes bacterium]|nr:MAG: 16S rRNA processing protein RimM [Bacteroidota bacterium]